MSGHPSGDKGGRAERAVAKLDAQCISPTDRTRRRCPGADVERALAIDGYKPGFSQTHGPVI
jgi:hypothetical protein